MRHLHSTFFILYSALALGALCAPNARAWGGDGHKAVAAIAEANLTPEARAAINKYLGGRSIVEFASWMDAIRKKPGYEYTDPWHSTEVDEKYFHTPAVTRPGGDVVTATTKTIADLRNHKTMPRDAVVVAIKLLVHMVGDMHCPVHVYFPDTIKNTRIKLTIDGEELTYHAVWDTTVVRSLGWDTAEWVRRKNTLDKDAIAAIAAGTPGNWIRETALASRPIYDWAKPGVKFQGENYKDFLAKATPLAESQIQKAGYRLAKALNDCFSQ